MEYVSKESGNPFLYRTMLLRLQSVFCFGFDFKVSDFKGHFFMTVEPGTGHQIWLPLWGEIIVYFTNGTSLIVTSAQRDWFPPTKLELSPPITRKVKDVINKEFESSLGPIRKFEAILDGE